MTGSIALDVVIGLTFIYLLYSLLATTIQEIIATSLGFRAKILEKAILRMLEDGKVTTNSRFRDRVEGILHLFGKKVNYKDKLVAASFYSHPMIKYLGEDNYHSKPAYINAQNFSKVMLDLLNGIDAGDMKNMGEITRSIQDGTVKTEIIATVTKDGAAHPLHTLQCSFRSSTNADSTIPAINEETQLYLKSLLADAQYDLDKFRAQLEGWFDMTMERATGWYKRYVQLILLVIGLGMAAFFNVDTIAIAKKLTRDPKVREQLVQSANAYLEQHKDLAERIDKLRAAQSGRVGEIDSLRRQRNGLTGADSVAINSSIGELNTARQADAQSINEMTVLKDSLQGSINEARKLYNEDISKVNNILGLGWKESGFNRYSILGWLLTALAISLGAPFWFDLLNKLMKLRGAGAKAGADTGSNAAATAAVPPTIQIVNNTPDQSSEEAVG